jgi:predicted O-methyltransferase YrrM
MMSLEGLLERIWVTNRNFVKEENNMTEKQGKFESMKFAHLKPRYLQGLKEMLELDFDKTDYIHHFPAFVGHLTLARFLSLYEAYKMTLSVAGHVAEVGVFKGAGSIFFAKLIKIFEPQSLTLVHGFDWFKGAKVTVEERYVEEGECQEDYEKVMRLIKCQELDNIIHIHDLDVINDLEGFFEENAHLQFKLIFLDCGIYDVVSSSIKHFWPRLTSGGIMLFDHYSHEFAPGEVRAIRELIPGAEIKTFPFGWMPTAYVVKP